MTPPLWKHQEEALRRACFTRDFALFFEMGCGKSRTLLEILRHRFNEEGRVMKTLILCPPIVIANWVNEWKLYTKINTKTVIPLIGPSKKRAKDFYTFAGKNDGIFITNYEALGMKDLFKLFVDWAPEVVVFDESHKLKSHCTNRSKCAAELTNPFDLKTKTRGVRPHVYLLSGSPVLNSPMDLFQQFKVMDGGETFGSNYFAFRGKYFRDRNAGMPSSKYFPKWEVRTIEKDGFAGTEEIKKLLSEKSMRVEKKDCLDLPPEISIVVNVGMSQEQTRLYREMKNELLTYFKSKACVATLAITKALRLMQITSGYIAAETPGDTESRVELALTETPKLTAVRELLQELVIEQGQKVLLWASFRYNYVQLREILEGLKIKYVEVHGDVPEGKKREAVSTFQSDGDCSVFLGHPGSGGIGINLTAARYSIFYSRTFSLEHYLQARARNHRGGSREAGHVSITHYDIVCEDTIDALALSKLRQKQDLSDSLLSLASELAAQNI
jgi:SNF2 family DNA or RNA helicase